MKQNFLTKTSKLILSILSIGFAISISTPVIGQTDVEPSVEQLEPQLEDYPVEPSVEQLEPQLEDYPEVEKFDLINTLSKNVLQDLSQQIGVKISDQHVIEFERKNWTNNCLELVLESEKCLEVITPGWLVTVTNDEQRYVYHTDERGFNVKLEKSAPIVNN